jgi:hypothetical protein
MVDRDVFVQNLGKVKHRKILLIRIGLSLLFIALIAFMWMSKSGVSSSLQWTLKTAATVFFAGLAFWFITLIQKMCRRLELHCPNCHRNLSGPLSHKVLESGQCFQCGVKLF